MSKRSDEADFFKERERERRDQRADAERRRNSITHPAVQPPAPEVAGDDQNEAESE